MKSFDPVTFDAKACKRQLSKFRELLKSRADLSEAKDILPFFKHNKQLAAFIGGRFPELAPQDLIAFEYDLWGDFACDIVVGNKHSATFCFVEFEEGQANSIFRKLASKATPEWAPRFEHGFSQIVDWFWKLDRMRSDYAHRFGASQINVYGLLVVGRDEGLELRELDRLKWRMQKVPVDSQHVHCITYDQFFLEMKHRFREYQSISR